jgi:predicted transcriptional regulator
MLELTDLQLAILDVLWERDEASVTEILEALQESRVISQPTVSTLLTRMQARDLVTSRRDGRRALYRAVVDREEARKDVLMEFAERSGTLFQGEIPALVAGLLDLHPVTPQEIRSIKQLIEAAERRKRSGRRS